MLLLNSSVSKKIYDLQIKTTHQPATEVTKAGKSF